MCQRFSVLRASSRAASKPGPVTCSARVSNGEAAGEIVQLSTVTVIAAAPDRPTHVSAAQPRAALP